MQLSIIVPVYREEKNIPEYLGHIGPILDGITRDYEIIFALDPSPDRTEELILAHRARDPRIKLLKFSRRFGQPMAILAGMQYSTGEAAIVMDVDLQDPPELVKDMVAKWREGYEVVLPQRRQRTGEPWIKKLVSAIGYKVINKIADVQIPPNTGDFRLMSRRVVQEVLRLKEVHGFLRGMVAVVGFKQAIIPFDRPARHAGETNYNRFLGSLRIGFNGIFCFSTYALQLSTMLGFLIAGFSFLLMGIYLFYKLMGWTILWGNPTLVILISFLGGIQLISVGILGEYIGRIYEEVRDRPKFIVDRAEVWLLTGMSPSATSKWPKVLPPLSPEQKARSDEFMQLWHVELARQKRYGLIERFNHTFPVRHSPRQFKTTLEIGAGLGEHLEYERLNPEQERNYFCNEFRENMAAEIRRRHPRVQTLVQDCQQRLDFPDGFFDRYLAIHVLEHLPDLPAALREAYRLLNRQTGWLLAVIPTEGSFAYSLARKISAERVWNRRFGRGYAEFYQREHLNLPHEIIGELTPYFEIKARSFFPLPFLPFLFNNLCIGLALQPRPQPLSSAPR